MTVPVRHMRRGDLWPPLRARFQYASTGDLSTDITTSTPAYVIVRGRGAAAPIVNRAPGVVTTPGGGVVEVSYEWAPGDTDTPGDYFVEVEFVVGGKPVTAPTNDTLRLVILADRG